MLIGQVFSVVIVLSRQGCMNQNLGSFCRLRPHFQINFLSHWIIYQLAYKLVKTSDSLPAILCFLNVCGGPCGRRGALMCWSTQDISGPNLALHFPYLPISAGETSILISAECRREPVGDGEGVMEREWKEGVHLIRRQRIREDLGERGPNVLRRGTSSLSNYHRVVSLFYFLFLFLGI